MSPLVPNKLKNIKLTLSYDGTDFLGWQETRMGPSIENTLKQVLEQILQHDIKLQAASRTDAGVHAMGQIVNFFSSRELHLSRLQNSLNGLLPKTIAITSIEEASPAFHPTLDCIGKEYHYHICYETTQQPFHRHYSWHYPKDLNIQSMRDAANQLKGERDFSSFCNVKKNHTYKDYKRRVDHIEITELGDKRLRLEIRGNNFLYKMVRNLVGTIAYVGCGKIAAEAIPSILAGHYRPLAGITAPAHGLCLVKVFYS